MLHESQGATMTHTLRLRYIIVTGAVLLAACAPPPAPSPEAMMEEPTTAPMMEHETPAAEAMTTHDMPTAEATMEPASEDAMAMAEWLGTPLVDAVTGQPFQVSDHEGKVVLVETMAVWCSTCRAQQEQIRLLHQQLGAQGADLVSISLDIDPNEDAQYLKAYVEQTGFEWSFAVAPADLSRAIGQTYGDQYLNPPSAPVLIIDRHGVAHPLAFGVKSAADLQAAAQPFLDGTT
jgi:cytochrome oxidase Cu insertion factor (SCO1/SenC/PrrC family)